MGRKICAKNVGGRENDCFAKRRLEPLGHLVCGCTLRKHLADPAIHLTRPPHTAPSRAGRRAGGEVVYAMIACLDFDNVADMTQRFEALGAGGKVTMPLQDTFWGAKFGTLTDAFGVQWMFNCEHKAGS
ncbi:MAG: VOC family protein [Vicinamibacterales bacterium]